MLYTSFVDLVGSLALDFNSSGLFYLDAFSSGNSHHFVSSKRLFPQLCRYSASRLSMTKAVLCISV